MAKGIIIEATFIGENKSLNYINGKPYKLIVTTVYEKPHEDAVIKIEDSEGNAQPCLYESVISFLSNWNNVKHPYGVNYASFINTN
jgi:hypothetical protein